MNIKVQVGKKIVFNSFRSASSRKAKRRKIAFSEILCLLSNSAFISKVNNYGERVTGQKRRSKLAKENNYCSKFSE